MVFVCFGTGSGIADCDWRTDFSSKGDGYSFSQSQIVPLRKQRVITTKQHRCWFSVLDKKIQNLAAWLALQAFVTTFTILSPCMEGDTNLS